MSESQNHIELVNITFDYIQKKVPSNCESLIECDSMNTQKPTKIIGGYIPDVFFVYRDTLIIGEAKTEADFERRHSKEQYDAYIHECCNFEGKAFLIIAVPWNMILTAKNYFRRLKARAGFSGEIIILNNIGGEFLL
jgi:hypothetical protein